jgi:hypothetical protein
MRMIHNKVIGQLLGRLAQPQEHGKMVEERTIDASKVMEADGLEEAERVCCQAGSSLGYQNLVVANAPLTFIFEDERDYWGGVA